MIDSALQTLIEQIVSNGLIAAGVTSVKVRQAYQPIQVGVPKGALVAFFKVTDHRYGWVQRRSYVDPDTQIMMLKTVQQCETTFQMQALVPLKSEPPTQMTASDLINAVAAIMQDNDTLAILKQNDVGIYRIIDVRNPYFIDDRDQNEACPSFDFTLTHKQTIIKQTPAVQSVKSGIYRI